MPMYLTMLWLLCMLYCMWNSVLSSSLCSSLQGITCCAGSYWNREKSTCEKCPFGYYGNNCSEACNFPHFGKECQSKCNCSPHLCDHIAGCFENVNLSSKTVQVQVSYDTHVTPYQKESTSSRYKDSSFVKTLPNSLTYTAITFVIAFVIFFGILTGTYFYKHCIKQTIPDGKQLDEICNQQERYNILLQNSYNERENNSDPAYLEPISNVYYEEIEIESNAETIN